MKRKQFAYPCLTISEPDRLLRRFLQAAKDAVNAPNPTSIQVDAETLKVLLEKLKGAP